MNKKVGKVPLKMNLGCFLTSSYQIAKVFVSLQIGQREDLWCKKKKAQKNMFVPQKRARRSPVSPFWTPNFSLFCFSWKSGTEKKGKKRAIHFVLFFWFVLFFFGAPSQVIFAFLFFSQFREKTLKQVTVRKKKIYKFGTKRDFDTMKIRLTHAGLSNIFLHTVACNFYNRNCMEGGL